MFLTQGFGGGFDSAMAYARLKTSDKPAARSDQQARTTWQRLDVDAV